MVNSIYAQLSLPQENRNSSSLERFNKRLDLTRLPSKGVSTLFGWGEIVPISHTFFKGLSEQRATIKTVNSTFVVPKFFTKQVKLTQAVISLKNDLKAGCDLNQLLLDVKKIFFFTIALLIYTLKMPLLFHKTQVVDLTEISNTLPDVLEKGQTIFMFGNAAAHFVDTAWILRCGKAQSGAKIGVKLLSSTIKVSVSCMGVAALFFGFCLSPFILLTASTISFTSSLVSKMLHLNLSSREQFALHRENALPV